MYHIPQENTYVQQCITYGTV